MKKTSSRRYEANGSKPMLKEREKFYKEEEGKESRMQMRRKRRKRMKRETELQ